MVINLRGQKLTPIAICLVCCGSPSFLYSQHLKCSRVSSHQFLAMKLYFFCIEYNQGTFHILVACSAFNQHFLIFRKSQTVQLSKCDESASQVGLRVSPILFSIFSCTGDTGAEVAPGIFRRGADFSDKGAKIWFSGHYKCQKSPKRSRFTFRRGLACSDGGL